MEPAGEVALAGPVDPGHADEHGRPAVGRGALAANGGGDLVECMHVEPPCG
jgi:hypothetical protein